MDFFDFVFQVIQAVTKGVFILGTVFSNIHSLAEARAAATDVWNTLDEEVCFSSYLHVINESYSHRKIWREQMRNHLKILIQIFNRIMFSFHIHHDQR